MSNIEKMVSVPRYRLEAARDCLVICQDQAFQSCECESCPECGLMPDECTGTECAKTCQCTTCEHCMNKDSIESLTALLSQPAEQRQGEPVKLPEYDVPAFHTEGSGNWNSCNGWNACLDEIAKLGPLYAHPVPVEHQGEPVAWLIKWASDGSFYMFTQDRERSEKLRNDPEFVATPLYTHADPGEVEQLRADLDECDGDRWKLRTERDTLRAQLADRDALLRDLDDAWNSHDGKERFYKLMTKVESLSASAEPSAPCTTPIGRRCPGDGVNECKACPRAQIGIDERAEFETFAINKGWLSHQLKQRPDGNYEDWGVNPEWQAWKARAALVRKP